MVVLQKWIFTAALHSVLVAGEERPPLSLSRRPIPLFLTNSSSSASCGGVDTASSQTPRPTDVRPAVAATQSDSPTHRRSAILPKADVDLHRSLVPPESSSAASGAASGASTAAVHQAFFEFNPAALEVLDGLKAPIYSIVAIGPARVGKSFWMSEVLRLLERERWGGGDVELSDSLDVASGDRRGRGSAARSTAPEVPVHGGAEENVTMGERGKNGSTSLEDTTRGGNERNSIWSNEPENLSLEAAPSAPAVYFETSDLSEACTDGVWLFPTAFRNHTILVFDLQGSDKGSDAEVRAADQLSAFVSLFSSKVYFFLKEHIERSKLKFFEQVVDVGRVLRNDSDHELRWEGRCPGRGGGGFSTKFFIGADNSYAVDVYSET